MTQELNGQVMMMMMMRRRRVVIMMRMIMRIIMMINLQKVYCCASECDSGQV